MSSNHSYILPHRESWYNATYSTMAFLYTSKIFPFLTLLGFMFHGIPGGRLVNAREVIPLLATPNIPVIVEMSEVSLFRRACGVPCPGNRYKTLALTKQGLMFVAALALHVARRLASPVLPLDTFVVGTDILVLSATYAATAIPPNVFILTPFAVDHPQLHARVLSNAVGVIQQVSVVKLKKLAARARIPLAVLLQMALVVKMVQAVLKASCVVQMV